MDFINLLNRTAVVFIPNLGAYGWHNFEDVPGFEAYSPFGEIRAFRTYAEAHAWRVQTIREALGLVLVY